MSSKCVAVVSWSAGDGRPAAEAAGALGCGRRLARALDTRLVWVWVGPLPADAPTAAARFGADALDHLDDARLAAFAPDACVAALAGYCRDAAPALVLFAQDAQARIVAPRLAGRIGGGVLMNVVGIERAADGIVEATAAAYGGDTRMVYALEGAASHVLALAPHALEAEPGEAAPTSPAQRTLAAQLDGATERVRVIERAKVQGPRLQDADIIVSGGRGLGARESYKLVEELAAALGGQPGASRPLVDDGWVDASRQVGLTGSITRPALYVAAGISGASQHMAGCAAARTIVAINSDPDAAIFRYARYGVVGDCREILPALVQAVRG
jgi:electron transfer flavoprotein alpha subunit